MAISKDLFLAILAMDSYNRGYGAGIGAPQVGLGLTGQIGNATLSSNSSALDTPGNAGRDQAASFFAQASSLNGETVISYRGTDDPNPLKIADFWTGSTIGAGYAAASQAKMAQDFYESVTGHSMFTSGDGNTILTGHYLGGGPKVAAPYSQLP